MENQSIFKDVRQLSLAQLPLIFMLGALEGLNP